MGNDYVDVSISGRLEIVCKGNLPHSSPNVSAAGTDRLKTQMLEFTNAALKLQVELDRHEMAALRDQINALKRENEVLKDAAAEKEAQQVCYDCGRARTDWRW